MRDAATLTIGYWVAALLLGATPAVAQGLDATAGFASIADDAHSVGHDAATVAKDAATAAQEATAAVQKSVDDSFNEWAATVSRVPSPKLTLKPRDVRFPKPTLAARPTTTAAIKPEIHDGPAAPRKHALAGIASFYWQGTMTASGEPFDKRAMTAAHPTLPFGTKVKVYCANTGREVVVRINDRGPFKPGRVIDLSEAAAEAIGMQGRGLTTVQLEVMRN